MGQVKKNCYDAYYGRKACEKIVQLKMLKGWTLAKMEEMSGCRNDVLARVIAFGRSSEEDLASHTVTRNSGFCITTIWDLASLVQDGDRPYDPMKYYLVEWCGYTPERMKELLT